MAGKDKYSEDQDEHGRPPVSYLEYLKTDDFIKATAENWESEFLQMFAFVMLPRFRVDAELAERISLLFAMVVCTIWLREKGSPESKPVDAPHDETGG